MNIKAVILSAALLCSPFAHADNAAEEEAGRLLDAMGMDTLLQSSIDAMLNAQVQQQPTLAPYQNVMRQFLGKYMSYSALKPQFIELYASEFSAAELAEIRHFYATATGQKALVKMPALMSKGAMIGSQTVQAHMAELQQMIAAESARIKQQQPN